MATPLEDLQAEIEAEVAAKKLRKVRFRVIEGGKKKP